MIEVLVEQSGCVEGSFVCLSGATVLRIHSLSQAQQKAQFHTGRLVIFTVRQV